MNLPSSPSPQSLSGLFPFVNPYKARIALAGLFLLQPQQPPWRFRGP